MKINEVKVGQSYNHPRYGKGMITATTKRTITVTFENGMTCKNTYKYADAYFYISDF